MNKLVINQNIKEENEVVNMLFNVKEKPDYDVITDKERFIELYGELVYRDGAEDLLKWLVKSDFFEAPASTAFHSNVKGGLCHHTLLVYDRLCEELVNDGYVLDAELKSTAFIVAALHDLCKVDFYVLDRRNVKVDEKNNIWEKVPYYRIDEQLPFGHGEKSVYIIQSFMNLTREEALAIRWHMGDFSEAYGGCSKAYAMCPLVVYLHIADIKASYFDEGIYDYVLKEWK